MNQPIPDQFGDINVLSCLGRSDFPPELVMRCFQTIPRDAVDQRIIDNLMHPWRAVSAQDKLAQVVRGLDEKLYLVLKVGSKLRAKKLADVVTGISGLIAMSSVFIAGATIIFFGQTQTGADLWKRIRS